VTILYAISGSMLWDNSILSDSIYGSLFNIVLFTLIGHLVGCWTLTLARVAGLAVLWGYSIWTRDSGAYFTLLPAALLIAVGATGSGRGARRFGHLLVFLSGTVIMTGAYVLLNWYRSGEVFFSITGIENWLRPIFDMARYGYAQPFMGDGLVDRTVRETMVNYEFPAQLKFIVALHERCHCTPTQMQSLVFAKFLSSAWEHPFAYGRVIIRNFDYLGLGSLLANPLATINEFVQLGTSYHRRIIPVFSIRELMALRQNFSGAELVLVTLSTLSTVVSVALFSLFAFGLPWLGLKAWRRREAMAPALIVALFLWFVFVSVSLAFSIVHREARHLLPILPAASVGIVFMFRHIKPVAPPSLEPHRLKANEGRHS
jgi:hypothetical protein